MTKDLSNSNLHRRKEDGSHDSICLACLATISTEAALAGTQSAAMEPELQAHVCAFSFDSARSAQSI